MHDKHIKHKEHEGQQLGHMDNHYIMRKQTKEKSLLQSRMDTSSRNQDNNNKRTGHRSFRKSTFHKNGRIYVLAHQDWYTQYRRQRGPRSVMGSTEDGETGAGGQEVGEDEIELRGGGDLEDESLDRETETIQAVKRPTVVGVPESISYQQKGLIPKARSAAAVVRRHCRDSRMDNRQRG
ncbi:hypothetical protein BGX29_001886 [Mortierella sp. GBA35]|nr:hypothetical protein BGX29_001886 [Mortierella sp. GBA35]